MISAQLKVKVIVFISIGILLIGGLIFSLGHFQVEPTSSYFVDFKNAGALKSGSLVKISGVNIGRVANISFIGGKKIFKPDPQAMVRAEISINQEIQPLLGPKSVFSIASHHVLAQQYIDIQLIPPEPNQAPLAESSIIIGKESQSLGDLFQNVGTLVTRVDALLLDNQQSIGRLIIALTGFLEESQKVMKTQDFEQTLTHLNGAIKEIESISKTINAALPEKDELRSLIQSTISVSKRIEQDLPSIQEQIKVSLTSANDIAQKINTMHAEEKDNIKQLIRNLTRATNDFNMLVQDTQAILNEIKQGKGTVGKLVKEDTLYKDVSSLVQDVKSHPWKLIWGD